MFVFSCIVGKKIYNLRYAGKYEYLYFWSCRKLYFTKSVYAGKYEYIDEIVDITLLFKLMKCGIKKQSFIDVKYISAMCTDEYNFHYMNIAFNSDNFISILNFIRFNRIYKLQLLILTDSDWHQILELL